MSTEHQGTYDGGGGESSPNWFQREQPDES